MKTINYAVTTLALCSVYANASTLSEALTSEAIINLKSRVAVISREFDDTPQNDRDQAALGLILGYETGTLFNAVSLGIAGYHVEQLYASGKVANDMLSTDDNGNQEDRFSKVGEAYIKIQPGHGFDAVVGRQKVKSMLLTSSGQRAIPNTYQGVSMNYSFGRARLYSQWYNKWSRRHDHKWENFSTDLANSKIDHIWVNGVAYKHGPLSAEFEYLNSDDYLTKTGLRASYLWQLADQQTLTLKAGYFTSRDSGDLFVVGAESGELDDEDTASVGERSENEGEGAYLQLLWSVKQWTFSTALSQFDDAWIEDNFSGDHGTNPFPTRSIIFPDFTNANERSVLASVKYDWRDIVPGLTTQVTYVKGRNAENSADASLGTGEENYRELFIKYSPKSLKGLSMQWRYHDYRGKKTGNVDGIKGDDIDHRIFIDYTFKF